MDFLFQNMLYGENYKMNIQINKQVELMCGLLQCSDYDRNRGEKHVSSEIFISKILLKKRT